MGAVTGFLCGRRGASGQYVGLSCDTAACRTRRNCWSAEEYAAAKALGWSRDADGVVACPAHSGVAPTIDVQQELVL
jgi:hypothetical protein